MVELALNDSDETPEGNQILNQNKFSILYCISQRNSQREILSKPDIARAKIDGQTIWQVAYARFDYHNQFTGLESRLILLLRSSNDLQLNCFCQMLPGHPFS